MAHVWAPHRTPHAARRLLTQAILRKFKIVYSIAWEAVIGVWYLSLTSAMLWHQYVRKRTRVERTPHGVDSLASVWFATRYGAPMAMMGVHRTCGETQPDSNSPPLS